MAMYQIATGLIIVGVFALVWYPLNVSVQYLLTVMVAEYGITYFPINVTRFLTNFWAYMPVLVFFAVLLWVYVYSQKEAREAVYYG
jgi:hypothetical protein